MVGWGSRIAQGKGDGGGMGGKGREMMRWVEKGCKLWEQREKDMTYGPSVSNTPTHDSPCVALGADL